jgi:hypothetical protein
MSRRSRRTVRERFGELRLPAPERAAARSERRVEAALRRERDNVHTPERRAAAIEAERRRLPWYGGVDW